MPNIFNEPPSKWDGMDWAQFNMLTDNREERRSNPKRSPGGGCGCLTASVAILAVLLLLLI